MFNRHQFEAELEKYRALDELSALAFTMQSINFETMNDTTMDALLIDLRCAIKILQKWDPYMTENNLPFFKE